MFTLPPFLPPDTSSLGQARSSAYREPLSAAIAPSPSATPSTATVRDHVSLKSMPPSSLSADIQAASTTGSTQTVPQLPSSGDSHSLSSGFDGLTQAQLAQTLQASYSTTDSPLKAYFTAPYVDKSQDNAMKEGLKQRIEHATPQEAITYTDQAYAIQSIDTQATAINMRCNTIKESVIHPKISEKRLERYKTMQGNDQLENNTLQDEKNSPVHIDIKI